MKSIVTICLILIGFAATAAWAQKPVGKTCAEYQSSFRATKDPFVFFVAEGAKADEACTDSDQRQMFFGKLGYGEILKVSNKLIKKCNLRSHDRMDCIHAVNARIRRIRSLNGGPSGETAYANGAAEIPTAVRAQPIVNRSAILPNVKYKSCLFNKKIYIFTDGFDVCETEPVDFVPTKNMRIEMQNTAPDSRGAD